ncbi:MAG TPA: hypothetical protein DCS23_03545 [Candidatus Yonathbacteria bacterium]|nr:hypothetical protein [Candidatus Yonathbacteria bacterium]
MQDIEFEEDIYKSTKMETTATPSLMKSILFKLGVKDVVIVNYILLGVAVFFFGVAIFLYADVLGSKADVILTSHLQ